MNGKIRLALCSFLVLALLLWAAPVLAVPPIPHAFYGTVEINDGAAPRGSVVSVKINGENAGSYTTTVVGQYGSLAERDYLAVSYADANDGDTITFYVNGHPTGQTATFEIAGGPTEKNLTVTIVGGGGGGGTLPFGTVGTNLFGSVADFLINEAGVILETITATSADGNLILTIPSGTTALDKDGNPLSTLTSAVDPSPPAPPEGANIIELAYNFGPAGATFDPAITFEYTYDPAEIPEGVAEGDLVLAYYDEVAGEWVELPSTVDPLTHTITASVSHFTTFAIIAPPAPPPPAPAAFSVTNLSVKPLEVQPEEAVTIAVSVANTGGTEGSYTVVLKINGVKEAEESVTVAAGGSQDVSFTLSKEDAGSYSVAVDGLSASFTVVAPVAVAPTPPEEEATPTLAPEEELNWPMIGGIIGAVVVILVIVFVARRRTRAY